MSNAMVDPPSSSQPSTASSPISIETLSSAAIDSSAPTSPGAATTTTMDDETLPPGFEKQVDNRGRTFYINHNTQSTHWKLPEETSQQHPAASDQRLSSDPAYVSSGVDELGDDTEKLPTGGLPLPPRGKTISEVEHKQALNALERRLRQEFAQSTAALEESLRKSHAADTRALRDEHAAQVDGLVIKNTTESLGPFAGIMQQYEAGNAALRETTARLEAHVIDLEGQIAQSERDRASLRSEAERRRSTDAALRAARVEANDAAQRHVRDMAEAAAAATAATATALEGLQASGAARLRALYDLLLQQQRRGCEELRQLQVRHVEEMAKAQHSYDGSIAALRSELQASLFSHATLAKAGSTEEPAEAATGDAVENKMPSRPASPTAPLAAKLPVSSAETPFTEIEQRIHDMSLSLMDTSRDLFAISTKIDLLDISKHEAGLGSSSSTGNGGEEKAAHSGSGENGGAKQSLPSSPSSPSSQMQSAQQSHDAMLALELSASSDLWRETSTAHEQSFSEALRIVKERQELQRQEQQRQEHQRQERERQRTRAGAASPSPSPSPSPTSPKSPSPSSPNAR